MSDIPEDRRYGDRRYGVRGVRETQEREIRRAALAERSRIAAERMKELLEEEKQIDFQRADVMKVVKKENKKRFYQDLDRAGATGSSTITKIKLIDLFNNSAKEQLEGNIKLDKEKVKNEVRNTKNLLEKKKTDIWTKDVAVAYGKLLTAIDPMTSRIHSIPGMGGRRKTKRRKTRKTRKRRRIGKNKKQLKRLKTQYRRFRIAKGDKRFKGTKGLVKWSKPSKAKRKGKRRSRRIYHRKRR
jgi:hypothetical protein